MRSALSITFDLLPSLTNSHGFLTKGQKLFSFTKFQRGLSHGVFQALRQIFIAYIALEAWRNLLPQLDEGVVEIIANADRFIDQLGTITLHR